MICIFNKFQDKKIKLTVVNFSNTSANIQYLYIYNFQSSIC